jgi:hypothetical protein
MHADGCGAAAIEGALDPRFRVRGDIDIEINQHPVILFEDAEYRLKCGHGVGSQN